MHLLFYYTVFRALYLRFEFGKKVRGKTNKKQKKQKITINNFFVEFFTRETNT